MVTKCKTTQIQSQIPEKLERKTNHNPRGYFLPALFYILSMTRSSEFYRGGVHDNVTERHTDHMVIIDGANVKAVQIGQSHHELLPAHGPAIGLLPVLLKLTKSRLMPVATCCVLYYFKLL